MYLGSFLVSLSPDSKQTLQKIIRNFQLNENFRKSTNSPKNVTHQTISSAQGWLNFSSDTFVEKKNDSVINFTQHVQKIGTNIEQYVPMRPPGTANCSSFCSAKRETILEKMGLQVSLPSLSLDTKPGRTSISMPTCKTIEIIVYSHC